MSSELKLTNIKAKDGTSGISIADSSGAITASGGIANAGTISAGTFNGTIGLTATHTVGWQHIQDFHHTSSSSAANFVQFQNVFSNDYMMFCIHVGHINFAETETDFHFRLMNSSGAIGGPLYYGTSHITEHDTTTDQNASYIGETRGWFMNNMKGNVADKGAHGHIWIYNVTSPTILGTSTDRGTNYRPYVKAELVSFNHGYNSFGLTTSDFRYDGNQDSSHYTGIYLFGRKGDATADSNLQPDSHLSLWGLKGKATA
ncbi:hypothetical protein [uncultured Mediterranean phage uvMED]|nr:hypothetical protein [uncultured Mediterranean phage uvMED]